MKEYFALDVKEKRQELVMIFFFFILIATISIGMYTQWKNLDYDSILVPLSLFSAGCFFLLNGMNGLGKGNLILKYTPVGIPFLLQYLLRKIGSVSENKARAVTAKLLGISSLLIATACFFFGVVFIVKGASAIRVL